jgi:hypothetical protein
MGLGLNGVSPEGLVDFFRSGMRQGLVDFIGDFAVWAGFPPSPGPRDCAKIAQTGESGFEF